MAASTTPSFGGFRQLRSQLREPVWEQHGVFHLSTWRETRFWSPLARTSFLGKCKLILLGSDRCLVAAVGKMGKLSSRLGYWVISQVSFPLGFQNPLFLKSLPEEPALFSQKFKQLKIRKHLGFDGLGRSLGFLYLKRPRMSPGLTSLLGLSWFSKPREARKFAALGMSEMCALSEMPMGLSIFSAVGLSFYSSCKLQATVDLCCSEKPLFSVSQSIYSIPGPRVFPEALFFFFRVKRIGLGYRVSHLIQQPVFQP